MSEKIQELRQTRIQKLNALKQQGVDPYPVSTGRTHAIAKAIEQFGRISENKDQITLAGRIKSIRTHGKLTFGNVEDGSGSLQFLLRDDVLGEKNFQDFNDLVDIGDFVELKGALALSKTGEKTLETTHCKLLTKSIRPIPTEFYGLKDLETRLRKRYLDFLLYP